MKVPAALLILAFVLWTAMFLPAAAERMPFWPMMVLSSGLLAGGAIIAEGRRCGEVFRFRRIDVPAGLLSALLLYGVFFVGHFLSVRILPFAAGQVESIYAIRPETASWQIALLLFFWIGTAEEIFWRGFVQRRLGERLTPFAGFVIAAALYAGVHLPSLNFMLIAAAGICGGFWGLLFLATGRLWPVIISHALWDVLIFILFPIR